MLTRVWILVGALMMVCDSDSQQTSPYDTIRTIQSQGYVAEAHRVVTPDGYILEMHRIPYKRHEISGASDRPVVFVMHGLTAASNSFIFIGPETAIAYNLADAGFDVWLGNARGTRNSRSHVSLDPDSPEDRHQFFDFTWEEIGYYDISTMIDYTLNYTNQTKLHYIGHSQGGTVFLVLNSLRPEYNEKFASAHFLAGVGYKKHFPHTLLGPIATFTNTIYRLGVSVGIVEILRPLNITTTSGSDWSHAPEDYCWDSQEGQKETCQVFMNELIVSGILDEVSMLSHLMGGASIKQIAHYGQNIQNGVFRRWDYGRLMNFQKYGSIVPPKYDISLVTVNTTMHYTISDSLLGEEDVYAMAEVIPNTIVRKVARDSFLHLDFVLADDVKELVTDYIVEAIRDVHSSLLVEVGLNPDGEPETNASASVILSFVFNMYLIIYSICCIINS